MNTELETTETILRRLGQLLSHSDDPLEVWAKDWGARVNWMMKPTFATAPYLIGKEGKHVRAITHLVGAIGMATGVPYVFSLKDPDTGPAGPWSTFVGNPNYSADELVEFLDPILEALGVQDFLVESEAAGLTDRGAAKHEITIFTRLDEDFKLLGEPTFPPDPATTLAALNHLFDAAAHKQGGKVTVLLKREHVEGEP